jgi:hypothetical protein
MIQKIFVLVVVAFAAHCLADIRPAPIVGHSPTEADSTNGRTLLAGVLRKWGGAEPWSAAGSIEANMSDHWPMGPTLWINRSTGQLDFLQYTVRDMYRFVTGVMRYQDFKQVGSLNLPHTLTALEGLETDEFVHEMRITAIRTAPIQDPRVFVPEPSRFGRK